MADIFCTPDYPSVPPRVNLMTTGKHAQRPGFAPTLLRSTLLLTLGWPVVLAVRLTQAAAGSDSVRHGCLTLDPWLPRVVF